jgi:hypothetical protein
MLYGTHLFFLNIFILFPLYQTTLQAYIRLFNTRWHRRYSKAKLHKSMTLEKGVLYMLLFIYL